MEFAHKQDKYTWLKKQIYGLNACCKRIFLTKKIYNGISDDKTNNKQED